MFWKNPIQDNKYLEGFKGGYYFYLHIDQKRVFKRTENGRQKSKNSDIREKWCAEEISRWKRGLEEIGVNWNSSEGKKDSGTKQNQALIK